MAARHRPGETPPTLRIVAVVSLKGGGGKSTTSGLLAHAWAELGYRVAAVDADPQGTLTRWASDGDWQIPVFGMATSSLHHPSRGITGVIGPSRFDLCVVDTPPQTDQAGVVSSAMRAATDVVVTCAPTAPEWDALPRVWDLLDDVAALRTRTAAVSVLFNRVRASTTAPAVYRELLAEEGHYCLRAHLPMRERYAQIVGEPVVLGVGDTAVIDAAQEIVKRGGWS